MKKAPKPPSFLTLLDDSEKGAPPYGCEARSGARQYSKSWTSIHLGGMVVVRSVLIEILAEKSALPTVRGHALSAEPRHSLRSGSVRALNRASCCGTQCAKHHAKRTAPYRSSIWLIRLVCSSSTIGGGQGQWMAWALSVVMLVRK